MGGFGLSPGLPRPLEKRIWQIYTYIHLIIPKVYLYFLFFGVQSLSHLLSFPVFGLFHLFGASFPTCILPVFSGSLTGNGRRQKTKTKTKTEDVSRQTSQSENLVGRARSRST